jgi:hypothetical protein
MSEQEEKEILKELQRISRLLVIIAIKDQTQLQEKLLTFVVPVLMQSELHFLI